MIFVFPAIVIKFWLEKRLIVRYRRAGTGGPTERGGGEHHEPFRSSVPLLCENGARSM